MELALWLLGTPAYGRDTERADLPVSMPVTLLVYLALQAGWVSRSHLATLFWPETDESAARRNLRRLISRLPEVNFADGVEVEADKLRWLVRSDVHEFRRALGRGDWREATTLYTGPLLDGFHSSSEGVSTWLELERANLSTAFKDAAIEFSIELDEAGEFEQAAQLAARVLSEDPFAEEFVRLRMRSAFLAGRRYEALQVYEAFAELLQAELGLEPAEETTGLHRQLSAPDTPALPPNRRRQLVPVELLRPPQLAGRDTELQLLDADEVRFVLITGEPGIGKTRLLTAGSTENALYCRCLADMTLVPFHPVVRLITSQLEQGSSLPSLGAYQPDLETLVQIGSSQEALVGSDRNRLLEAIARYLELSCELVLFDDLQWADTGTLELIRFLHERGSLRLRAASRASEAGPALQRFLLDLSMARTINLEPLTREAMGELLAGLTGRKRPPERFAGWLHQLTGGNPMFALEALRSLFETRILRLEDEDWRTPIDRLTSDYSELPAAEAIRDVIRRRTTRLSEFAQRVLQAVAVLGDNANPTRLAQMTTLDEWQVLSAAEEANTAGLLNGTAFAHDLLRHAVYTATGPAVRSHLHREASRLFEEPLVKATHLAAAGDCAEAIPLWLDAYQQVLLQGLYRESLAILDAVEECDPEGKWALETMSRRATALHGLNEPEQAIQLARTVLTGTTDPLLRASAHNTIAGAQLNLGNLTEVEYHARLGAEMLEDDSELAVELKNMQVNALFHQGRLEEAEAVLVPLLEKVRLTGPAVQLPSLLTSLGSVRDAQERFEEGLLLHREAHLRAAELGQRHVQVSVILNMLYCLIDLNRPEEGLELAEQALTLGQFFTTDSLRANLAAAYNAAGQPEQAIRHYEELAACTTDPSLRCVAWTNLARFAHEAGETDRVREHLEQASVEVRQTSFPAMRARVAVALTLYGDDSDRVLARDILRSVDDATMPAWLTPDLKRARALL